MLLTRCNKSDLACLECDHQQVCPLGFLVGSLVKVEFFFYLFLLLFPEVDTILSIMSYYVVSNLFFFLITFLFSF